MNNSLTIDEVLFEAAKEKMIGTKQGLNGIGTLGEKTIHSVLKYYYCPIPDFHEVKIGSYVADICMDGEIFEVQTRQFNKMRPKLSYFLEEHDVTIIYPIPHFKWISWLDMETGELTSKRKSPKTGTFYNVIPELYRIKMFLHNPKLHFILTLIDVEETRYLNGWNATKKRGSSRMDGIPVSIYDELRIDCLDDYRKLLPPDLPDEFTSLDYARCAHISRSLASTGLNVLLETGIMTRTGKVGNAYTYRLN